MSRRHPHRTRWTTERAVRRPAAGLGFAVVRLASLALIPAAVIVDLFTPESWPFNRFLVGPPALAAASWSPAGTGAIGAAALATDIALTADKHSLGMPRAWLTMGMIVLVTVVAMYASHVRQVGERTMADVRSVAEAAQRALVRPMPARLGPTRMAAMYLAAAAQARIGGDFYEAQRTAYGIRLMIGDVRGKGLPAVEAASVMMSAFREAVHDAPDLPTLAGRLEKSIQRYSAQSGEVEERFATGLLAEVRPRGRRRPSPPHLRASATAAAERRHRPGTGSHRCVSALQSLGAARRRISRRRRPIPRRRQSAAVHGRRE